MILYNVVRPYNLPVAKGTIQTTNPSSTVGGTPLGIQYCEVVVNHVFMREAILPRPYGTLKSVGDARGRCIAWPHDRVIFQLTYIILRKFWSCSTTLLVTGQG